MGGGVGFGKGGLMVHSASNWNFIDRQAMICCSHLIPVRQLSIYLFSFVIMAA